MRAVALDPETLLVAYSQGAFPMTDSDGTTRWYTADPRGIIPLDAFHIPGTLEQTLRQRKFEITFNRDFAGRLASTLPAVSTGSATTCSAAAVKSPHTVSGMRMSIIPIARPVAIVVT